MAKPGAQRSEPVGDELAQAPERQAVARDPLAARGLVHNGERVEETRAPGAQKGTTQS